MKPKDILITAILFISFTGESSGATIIVALTGGDYTSVQRGLQAANAGDTVLVKAGIYHESVAISKSGSPNRYITLLGAPGAVIEGSGTGLVGIAVYDKCYIKVIGFEIRYFKGTGIPIGISVRGNSGNIEVRNNRVHHIENARGNAHGIAFYGTGTMPMSNIIVDGNEISDCKLGQSESLVFNGNVTNFTVSHNIIHDNDNIGIDFIGFERQGPAGLDQARDGICYGNTIYNISSHHNPTYGGSRSADGIYVDGGRNIIIERNKVYNCDIGIELASEHKGKNTQDIIVRSNFVSGSFQANIMAGGYAANKGNSVNIFIVNNTTHMGREGEIALQFNCDSVIIKNNIFYGKPDQMYLQNRSSSNRNVDVNNNIYFGQSSSSPGSWKDVSAKYVNPLLVNPYADMHIRPGSPARDAGVNIGNNISGDRDIDNKERIQGVIDIGADEYRR